MDRRTFLLAAVGAAAAAVVPAASAVDDVPIATLGGWTTLAEVDKMLEQFWAAYPLRPRSIIVDERTYHYLCTAVGVEPNLEIESDRATPDDGREEQVPAPATGAGLQLGRGSGQLLLHSSA